MKHNAQPPMKATKTDPTLKPVTALEVPAALNNAPPMSAPSTPTTRV